MRPRHLAVVVAIGICANLTGAALGASIDAAVLRRLIVMDDREVAPVQAARLDWAGRALVIGGWERWPDLPVILAHGPDVTAPSFPAPAHPPLFCVSAAPPAIISWTRGAEGGVLPASLRLSDGRLTLLDPAIIAPVPGPLIAQPDGSVVAACPLAEGVTEVRRLREGTASVLLARLPQPTCEALIDAAGGGDIWALCSGDPPRAWRIDPGAGVWAEAALEQAPRTDGLPPPFALDRAARRLVRVVESERVVLAEAVDAACTTPDAAALLVAGPEGLRVVDPTGQIVRRLWGAAAGPGTASAVSWPGEALLAHGYRDGDRGSVRLAVLGTEDVTVRLRFPEGAAVASGARIWVAERFRTDALGYVVEPIWGTLKALLRVRQVIPTDGGLVCDAVSEGTEGGVVDRLTGRNDPPPGAEADSRIVIGAGGEAPAAWAYSFAAAPRPGLSGWAEGGRSVGTLLAVNVTRRRLMPRGE